MGIYIEKLTTIAVEISDSEVNKHIKNLIEAITILHLHVDFVHTILQKSSDEEIQKAKGQFGTIKDFYSEVNHRSDLCLPPINHAVDFILNDLVPEIEDQIQGFFIGPDQISIKEKMNNFLK